MKQTTVMFDGLITCSVVKLVALSNCAKFGNYQRSACIHYEHVINLAIYLREIILLAIYEVGGGFTVGHYMQAVQITKNLNLDKIYHVTICTAYCVCTCVRECVCVCVYMCVWHLHVDLLY